MNLGEACNPTLQLDRNRDAQARPSPLLAALDATDARPETILDMWQHVVDGLTEQIALLDEDWTILVVNRSWAKVADLYGHFALASGTNYLEFCRERAAEGLAIAGDVVTGIEQIIEGKIGSLQLVYRASEPEAGHDHQLCINRFEVGGRQFASITRYDVTRLVELRRLREEFSSSVLVNQAQERQRIGREIHDATMQLMVCLDMKIGELERSCQTTEITPHISEMRGLVRETQEAIRTIAYLIHPPLLGNLTLPKALQALVEGFGRRVHLDVAFETTADWQVCCPAAEEAAYRIVQEALSNVHRHSRAKRVAVRVARRKATTHVIIADDGIGMQQGIRSGVGLEGMRSRLSELGGRLSIRSLSPGTAVIASIPAEAWPRSSRLAAARVTKAS